MGSPATNTTNNTASSSRVKEELHEVDCSHPTIVEGKNAWIYKSRIPYVFLT
jgi:hypothetical protein